jgi:putative toxin-antitoxin system antitoxin component (TIGR02293 family)
MENSYFTQQAFSVMGGKKLFGRNISDTLDAHKAVTQGIPRVALLNSLSKFAPLPQQTFALWLGLSDRTIDRYRDDPEKALAVDVASRLVSRTATVLKVIEEFGDVEKATQWLCQPAIGLDQQKPIDLLVTDQGTQLVDEYLGRMRHGVYS